MAIAMSVDGTTVANTLSRAGGNFVGRLLMRDALSPSDQQPSAPSPRVGFVSVYSRTTGLAYVLGGQDANTQAPLGEIWANQIASGAWMKISTGDWQPGRVLGATWSVRDGTLWVLDEIGHGFLLQARLTKIDPVQGQAQVLGQWPRLGVAGPIWLAADVDGRVILASSNRNHSAYLLVRASADGGSLVVDGFRAGLGNLEMPPIVDATGVRLITKSGRVQRLPGDGFLTVPPGRNLLWECTR
jgi:hypothetical protein